MNKKNIVIILSIILFLSPINILAHIDYIDAQQEEIDDEVIEDFDLEHFKKEKQKKKKQKKKEGKVAQFFGTVIEDIWDIHRNIFHWDSFRYLTSFFPFFVGARMIDEKLQNCFYDECGHKNINQPPEWCHDVAQWSIGVPVIVFGSFALFSKDIDKKRTGRVFLTAYPFVVFGKDLLKKVNIKACLRPWNEQFGCDKRSLGGFPSGHMAEATFTAVLWGSRFGPRYAIPLGLLATFIGSTFIACNRHYASQLVAGAGLGTIYAMAANRLIDSSIGDDVSVGMNVDAHGTPLFSVSYAF